MYEVITIHRTNDYPITGYSVVRIGQHDLGGAYFEDRKAALTYCAAKNGQ